MESNQETSGSTKSNTQRPGSVSMETSVLVYLPSRGTCLLQHVNLGSCTLDNLQEAFVTGMSELCDLHGRTGVGESGEYLTPDNDRQVGLGVLGLANFLRRYNITYEKFGEALRLVNLGHSASNEAGMCRLGVKQCDLRGSSDCKRKQHGKGVRYCTHCQLQLSQ